MSFCGLPLALGVIDETDLAKFISTSLWGNRVNKTGEGEMGRPSDKSDLGEKTLCLLPIVPSRTHGHRAAGPVRHERLLYAACTRFFGCSPAAPRPSVAYPPLHSLLV